MLITQELYKKVLLDPLERKADELKIVSGYATSAMAVRHLLGNQGFKLSVLVGMCPRDGITITNHRGFVNLVNDSGSRFRCHYQCGRPTHTKLYVWYSNGKPVEAYIGSANYTQHAFVLNVQNEAFAECDPMLADKYYRQQLGHAMDCLMPDIEKSVPIVRGTKPAIAAGARELFVPKSSIAFDSGNVVVTSVELPLYSTRTGRVPKSSGLNWGQRESRNRNQAYIAVPVPVQRTHFFPPLAVRFNVATDDGEMFEMSVAQMDGKAIETPSSNADIGAYFRRRLGLQSGAFVQDADLDKYGRRTVTFTKFDDENYYMDFSVPRKTRSRKR
jgi:hypothetical protein